MAGIVLETVHFQAHLQGGVVEAERLPYQAVEGPPARQLGADANREIG